jgi:DNA-binding protein HU-beta
MLFFRLTALEALDTLSPCFSLSTLHTRVHRSSPQDLSLRPDFQSITLSVAKEVRMAKSMTKSQIADHIAGKAGITKKTAVQLLDDLAALAYREAKNAFVVPGIGKLVLANRKARMGRNPQTGEPIKIPAKRVVKFRVAKMAKDSILGKK